MDVAVIVSTLASLALAVAKSLMEEQQRAQRLYYHPPRHSRRESMETREHI